MPKQYTPNDKLALKAQKLGLRARSVFKLEELDQKFRLLASGMKVLDLGASPGSWLQYTSSIIGKGGIALGLDIKPISHISDNIITQICDITQIEAVRASLQSVNLNQVDLLLSDISPSTTGIKYIDQKRSVELNKAIFEIAKQFLKPKGRLVMKVFQGEDLPEFIKSLKRYFSQTQVQRLSASRDRSREVYIVCQN